MESESLKILFIGGDEPFARAVAEMLGTANELVTAPNVDAATPRLSGNHPFHAILYSLPAADKDGLLQVGLMSVKKPRLPIIVLGPTDEPAFAAEIVRSGAQDYLAKDHLEAGLLQRAVRLAMERQYERTSLIDEKDNYYGVFDHLVEGVFRTTPDGHYVLANVALARIYGYESPVELMASLTDIAHRLYVEPGRREEFVRLMQASDTITNFESRIFRKDQTIIWISENCRVVRDGQGNILYYEGTVEDITQRRQMEQELRNSESLYHSLVETMPQGVFRRDLQGRFTFANQPYGKLVKIKPEDIIGKTDFDFFPKAAAEKYWHDDLRIMERGETMEILEEAQTFGMKEKEFHHVIKTPLRDETGRVIGLQGMVWDVTEKIRAEEQIRQANIELARSREELRASEALYHSLVETMPQSIFRKDLQGRYTFANQQFCKMLGKSYDEVIGKTVADFTAPEYASIRTENDRRVITTGKPFETIEESIFSPQPAYIQVVKMPIYDANGKAIGVQGMFWDITEQRLAAERIRQANAELSRSREELRAKNQVLEENLRMAREIQTAMLPQQYPVFPQNTPPSQSAFRFTHRYQPAEAVSGDFFSVTQLSDTEAGVFICDVAGHGVRAALVTAMIRALAEELKPLARDPGNFLRKLNSDLCAILKNTGAPMLTTAFYLVADWKARVVRFANAGHPKPLIIRNATRLVEPLANNCGHSQPALGLFDDPPYETTEIPIAPGDFLMLFTDGLYEVQGENEELYSQQRLLVDMQNHLGEPAGEMFDHLLKTIRAFANDEDFEDDVCLVGIELVGQPAQTNS